MGPRTLCAAGLPFCNIFFCIPSYTAPMTPALKIFLITTGAIAILVAGFFALNVYIYSEKQAETPVDRYRGTLSGEFVCLPHTDTSGPQTTECAFGIKTESGEYYAVDFSLMSQISPELSPGEHFSANGTITPIAMLSSDQWRMYPVEGIFSVTDSVQKIAYECDGDAKMCPDGSTVGRTGPACEFAACPPADRTLATVTTYLGGSPATLGVTVNPKTLVSDSRCLQDVQCVWAGTVEVRTVLSTAVSHGEHVLKLGEPQQFGDFNVTLTDVSPYPRSTETISESSYRFTFRIEKR